MAHPAEYVLDTAELGAARLRVVFRLEGDRFGHALQLITAEATIVLFSTVEGASSEIWPPSPPLQDLHLEHHEPRRAVLFGVGKAGRSHWSASVEQDLSAARLTFDFACRAHDQPTWLGTTYAGGPWPAGLVTSPEDTSLDTAEPLTFHLARPAGLCVQITPDVELALPMRMLWQQGRLSVCSQLGERFPATARWRYAVELFAG